MPQSELKRRPPLVIYEDDALLVINKPAGLNTHAPSPYAGEGVYEWLRDREPRWARLAIIHRLDKETSGVLVFGKTAEANRSLTRQFTAHEVEKKYRFLTDRPTKDSDFTVVSTLVRTGEKYVSRPLHRSGDRAETRFRYLGRKDGLGLFEAQPLTGRTHQIRVHAAERGIPILGDTLYGGTPRARLCLHAEQLTLRHPVTGAEQVFRAEVNFDLAPALALRAALIDPDETNAFRLIQGAADGSPGWYVSRLGEFLLSQGEQELDGAKEAWLKEYVRHPAQTTTSEPIRGVYHQILTRHPRQASVQQASPRLVFGEPAPAHFAVRENGLTYDLSFEEGYSVGLFLDQRDNRRRLRTKQVSAGFPMFPNHASPTVLNTFAYTCAFSVCAAKAGAHATSIDLSKKYLEWGRTNFHLNKLDPLGHDFIYGDVFDWLRRWTRRKRTFDLVILDPPTFSQSRVSGAFTAEKDFEKLVTATLPVLKAEGILLASTNASRLSPEEFLAQIKKAVSAAGRSILQQHYAPQPPDFPITRAEPGYLKTGWLRVR